jgi:hypothetical protein
VQDIYSVRVDEANCGHLQDYAFIFPKQRRDHSLQFVRPWLDDLSLQAKNHFVICPITPDSEQVSFPSQTWMAIERPDCDEKCPA